MKEEEIIYGILGSLCSCRKIIRCKIHCVYTDGKDCSIFSICFYQSGWTRMVGKISFSGETGKVYQCAYKDVHFSSVLNIVDLLLDLYNFEKEMLTESGN